MNKMFRALLVAACVAVGAGAAATAAQAQSESCADDVTYCIPGNAPGAGQADRIAERLGGSSSYAGTMGSPGEPPAGIVYRFGYPTIDFGDFASLQRLQAWFSAHPPFVVYFPIQGFATATTSVSFPGGGANIAKAKSTTTTRASVKAGKTLRVKLKLTKAQAVKFRKNGRMVTTTTVTIKNADGTSKRTFKQTYRGK